MKPTKTVRIKRAPLWRVDVKLVLKDGREINRRTEFRFDPEADTKASLLENDPLDDAMDQMLDDPEIKALTEVSKAQLTEFNIRIRRV